MTKVFLSIIILYNLLSTLDQNEIICRLSEDINECIERNPRSTIILEDGIHQTSGVKINDSDITLIIPPNSVLKLKDDAIINKDAFGGISNAVIMVEGKISDPLKNIEIKVEGLIDGNKINHPYSSGGVEGINMINVVDSKITGKGVIANCNGDGIDLDNIHNCIIQDIKLLNNGGSGLHFGSPRPIVGSKNNIVLDVISSGNGFERKRNGIDLSWPNEFGATFINCRSLDNYRNYEIEAIGSVVINCFSEDNGKVVENDYFGGSEFVLLNNTIQTNKSLISRKTKILLSHRVKKFLGLKTNKYLNDLNF